ncbi:MAG: lytic transglycosylase domain-containing protein [Sphingomonadaceae bacterium]
MSSRLPVPVGTVGRFRAALASLRLGQTPKPAASIPAMRPSGAVPRREPLAVRQMGAEAQARAANFEEMIRRAAQREGVDAHLVKAVVEAESGFDPLAVSSAGAKGLMQLMDETARSLGVRDSFDPAANLAGGAKYLRAMLDKFGSVPLALAAYNAGPGAVEKYNGVPPYKETRNYVERVLALQQRNLKAAGRNEVEGGADGSGTTA